MTAAIASDRFCRVRQTSLGRYCEFELKLSGRRRDADRLARTLRPQYLVQWPFEPPPVAEPSDCLAPCRRAYTSQLPAAAPAASLTSTSGHRRAALDRERLYESRPQSRDTAICSTTVATSKSPIDRIAENVGRQHRNRQRRLRGTTIRSVSKEKGPDCICNGAFKFESQAANGSSLASSMTWVPASSLSRSSSRASSRWRTIKAVSRSWCSNGLASSSRRFVSR